MGNFVIVIGRQYGGGGRKLGKTLAARFGVPYYDKELLAEAAKTMGYSEKIFDRADEKKPSILRSLLSFNYGATSAPYNTFSLTNENIYRLQSDVIRRICEKSSCVIVGRTADYIMREHPGLLSIFVHAPLEKRVAGIIERGEAGDENEARELINRKDHDRESYYNYFTNRHWGRASNYDLTVDSSKFALSEIVTLIEAHLKAKP